MLSRKQRGCTAYQIANNEFSDYFMKSNDPGDDFFKPAMT